MGAEQVAEILAFPERPRFVRETERVPEPERRLRHCGHIIAAMSSRRVVTLLDGFAVQRDVETVAFVLRRNAQPDHGVDDLENDKGHHGVVD